MDLKTTFFRLMVLIAAFTTTSATAEVYWNECRDMGGVRVFLGACECVDEFRFDPREMSEDYMCPGVGSERYYRALNAGQVDRTGRTPVDVVERFNRSEFQLDRECRRVWEAACYNAERQACICRNSHPIPIDAVWPNTRNCYGKFVSYGFGDDSPRPFQGGSAPAPRPQEGDFDGVLAVENEERCWFRYGEDVEGIDCDVHRLQGGRVQLTLDYSSFGLSAAPSCHFQMIRRGNAGLYIDRLNRRRVTVRYNARRSDPEVPEECRPDARGSGGVTSVDLLSVFCAISGH